MIRSKINTHVIYSILLSMINVCYFLMNLFLASRREGCQLPAAIVSADIIYYILYVYLYSTKKCNINDKSPMLLPVWLVFGKEIVFESIYCVTRYDYFVFRHCHHLQSLSPSARAEIVRRINSNRNNRSLTAFLIGWKKSKK